MDVNFFGIGCAVPTAHTGHTSFMLTAEDAHGKKTLVLTDAVDSPIQSMMKIGLDPLELDVLLLTHYHADHISALPSMLSTYNCMERTKPLTIVTNPQTTERAQQLLALLELAPPQLNFPLSYRADYADAAVQIKLLPGRHSVPSSMVRYRNASETLFYTSDTQYHEGIAEEAHGCDMLIHEATYADGEVAARAGHSSAEQAGRTAQAAAAGTLFLCHLCFEDYGSQEAILRDARSTFTGQVSIPEPLRAYRVRQMVTP